MSLIKRISLFQLLLISTFLNGLIFTIIIPLWHGPDEQAHFAQVQYLAEHNQLIPRKSKLNTTSQEILVSERLLGTERDGLGKNKFTHRPWYRIDYTDITTGKYENVIRSLPKSSRANLVIKEATIYPPLFYALSAGFYKITYPFSLIDRVFFTRLASVLMAVATVWLTYKIAAIVFPKRKLMQITAAILVSFQPMFSFLSASVNSDNLMNLLFTAFLYLCVDIILSQKLTFKKTLSLLATLVLGLLTKPHFVIALPLLFLLPLFFLKSFRQQIKRQPKLSAAAIFSLFLLIGIRFYSTIISAIKGNTISFSEISFRFISQPKFDISFLSHLGWTIRHTIAEVIPWYWGVFNWLGVTLPRIVNRIINRTMILAALGLIVWVFKNRRLKNWQAPQKALAFLGLSSLIFFTILLLWDWVFFRGNTYSFGIQGRYYFPLISAHMIFILLGLTVFIPQTKAKLKATWTKVIGVLAIILNFVGLHTLVSAYYSTASVKTFFLQLSQYKPSLFKYPVVIIWVTLYLLVLLIFSYKYLRFYEKNHQ